MEREGIKDYVMECLKGRMDPELAYVQIHNRLEEPAGLTGKQMAELRYQKSTVAEIMAIKQLEAHGWIYKKQEYNSIWVRS